MWQSIERVRVNIGEGTQELLTDKRACTRNLSPGKVGSIETDLKSVILSYYSEEDWEDRGKIGKAFKILFITFTTIESH